MAETGLKMPLADVRMQLGGTAANHRVDEVPDVADRANFIGRPHNVVAKSLNDLPVRGQGHSPPPITQGHDPISPVKDITDFGIKHRARLQTTHLERDRLVTAPMDGNLRVGGVTGIGISKSAAVADHTLSLRESTPSPQRATSI